MDVRWSPSPSSLIRKILPRYPAGRRLRGAWEVPGREYACLRCLEPLPATHRGTQSCAHCGLLNSPFLRERYWNLDPRAVRMTWALRLLLIPIGLPLLGAMGALAVVPLMMFWFTIAKLTEKLPSFPAAIFWSVAMGAFATIAVAAGQWGLAALLAAGVVLIPIAGSLGNRWKEERLGRVSWVADRREDAGERGQ